MLSLRANNPVYPLSGLTILLLQISLFICSLAPFHYGTWYEIEPVVLAMFVLAACNAAWLAIGFTTGWLTLRRPLHPILLCLCAWVGWQALATAFATSPWRSWFGHPAIGEGAGYYTALLLCYLLIQALWPRQRYRTIILAVASVNLLSFSWHYFNPAVFCGAGGWELGKWASHLAFPLGYLWIVFMATPHVRTRGRFVAMVAASIFILIWIARSKTAQYLLEPAIVGGSAVLWLRVVFRPRWLVPGHTWRMLAVAGCLLPLTWIVVSEGPDWLASADCSLPSRALFNQVSVSTIAHEPLRLLAGNGWGRYEDDLFKYTLVDGVYAFRDGINTPDWSVVNGHAFHAHDEAMEMLLALGLPGLLLWLALPMIFVRTIPSRLFWWCVPMLLALVGLQAFWFFLPHTLAYQALAYAAMSPPGRKESGPYVPGKKLAAAGALLAVIMAWSVGEHWQAMRYGETLSHAVTDAPASSYNVDWLAGDFVRGGDRFRAAADFYSHWVAQRTMTHEVNARDVDWYVLLMQVAHGAAQLPQSGAYLASADMRLLNLLFMNMSASPLDTLKPAAKKMLPEAVVALSAHAPLREDLTAPFLYSLAGFTGGNKEEAAIILSNILAVAPDHRVALWVMGNMLAAVPAHKEEGRNMMQRAVALGITRVFPVTQREADSVMR